MKVLELFPHLISNIFKRLQLLTIILFIWSMQFEPHFGKLGYRKGQWPLFKLSTKSNPNDLIDITNASSLAKLKEADFDNTKKTYLIIHGFTDNLDDPNSWQKQIKDNILSKENANVILVDWKYGAGLYNKDGSPLSEGFKKRAFYKIAATNTAIVGKKTAAFLKLNGINLQKTHCIGHSLGAQCCG